MIADKLCNQQILGCLIHHPQFLSEVDKYNFALTDFTTRFEKYIYSAIYGLYRSGATAIAPIDIDSFLSSDAAAHTTFTQNNGIEYLQDAIEFSQVENFKYYYDKFKKLNLLRDLKKQGIDIREFYIEDLTDDRANDVNSKFEELTTKDIIDRVKRKVLHLEGDYVHTGEVEIQKASQGIADFLTELNDHIDIGVPVQGAIYNQVISGAQRGALTIRSGSSGLGKALPNSTLIPTPNGYKHVGDIKVGDYLFDAFGKPTKVLNVYPQG